MPDTLLTRDEIAERGQTLYDTVLRPQVETEENIGKVIVIDIDTGEYEIDDDHLTAAHRAHAKREGAVLYATRVGFPTLSRRGGYRIAEKNAR